MAAWSDWASGILTLGAGPWIDTAACYAESMKINAIAAGLLLGLSAGLGVTFSQAETRIEDGAERLVVVSVVKGRVIESPVARRCLWVAVPAALVAAVVAHLMTKGANVGGVFLGAIIMSVLSGGWREDWPERFGRAGENARVSDTFLQGLVGAFFGAAASVHLRKQEEERQRRLAGAEGAENGREVSQDAV